MSARSSAERAAKLSAEGNKTEQQEEKGTELLERFRKLRLSQLTNQYGGMMKRRMAVCVQRMSALQVRSIYRLEWCQRIFAEMDENNNESISKKQLFRNLSAVRFQPRMTELASNHGYLNRWFSKLLLGNYRPAKRKDQVDKAEEKLMKILHKYDVGTNKLNLVDLTCMWHDVLHRVYVKVCQELRVGALYIVDVVYLKCCMEWGAVEADLADADLKRDRTKDINRQVSPTEFAHIIGNWIAETLKKSRYPMAKIMRFIGVCLSDSSLLPHMHIEVKKFILQKRKEAKGTHEDMHESRCLEIATMQWTKERKVANESPPRFQGVTDEIEQQSKQYMEVILQALDENEDKHVSQEEYASFLQIMPVQILSNEFFGKHFKNADFDASGTLTLKDNEFCIFMEAIMKSLFFALDTENKGYLTLDTMYQAEKLLTGNQRSTSEFGLYIEKEEYQVSEEDFVDFLLYSFIKAIDLEKTTAIPHFFCMTVLVSQEQSIRRAMFREKQASRKMLRLLSIKSSRRSRSRCSKGDIDWMMAEECLDVSKVKQNVTEDFISARKLAEECHNCGISLVSADKLVKDYATIAKKDKHNNFHVQDFLDETVRMMIFRVVKRILRASGDRYVAVEVDELNDVLASYMGATEAKRHYKTLFHSINAKKDGHLDRSEFRNWILPKEKQMIAFRHLRQMKARKTALKKVSLKYGFTPSIITSPPPKKQIIMSLLSK